MISFLHTYLPQPIFWQFGPVQLHWYGLCYVIAIVLGIGLAAWLGKRHHIFFDEIVDVAFYVVLFGLIGGRVYAVLLDWQYYLAHPVEIIAVWHGGMAIHGGIIAGIITLIVYCWRKRQSFWLWVDLLSPILALGQAIGRWGNYFNQEIFGLPTNVPWGIPIAPENRPLQYADAAYFQPTFLYESILDLLNFFILLFLFRWHPRARGTVFFVYLINYSLIRAALEFIRLDDTPLVYGIRFPILVSVGIIILSAAGLFWRWRSQPKTV